MQVEIWSDVVCPWCYIGKRRFEDALARFEHGDEVVVAWRSFELDPSAPAERPGRLVDHLARKYGMGAEQAEASIDRLTGLAADEGLGFRLDVARPGRTFDAHRLLHLAAERGVQGELKERLLAAYQCDGQLISDHDVLAAAGAAAGLEPEEVAAVLAGDRFAAEVRADEDEAHRLGVTGVPFFVVDRRYAVSGAQASDVLLDVLRTAWADRSAVPVVAGGDDSGDACGPEGCAV